MIEPYLAGDCGYLVEDLMEVSALMCDLPEYQEELERYVIDRAAFQNLSYYDGC